MKVMSMPARIRPIVIAGSGITFRRITFDALQGCSVGTGRRVLTVPAKPSGTVSSNPRSAGWALQLSPRGAKLSARPAGSRCPDRGRTDIFIETSKDPPSCPEIRRDGIAAESLGYRRRHQLGRP